MADSSLDALKKSIIGFQVGIAELID